MSAYINESDEVIIDNLRQKPRPKMFLDKIWSYYNDSNGNSYGSGQIYFSVSSNAGSSYGQLLSEAFLMIPDQVAVTYTGATATCVSYGCSYKGSHLTALDSIQFSMSNVQVVNQTQHQCFHSSAMLLINSDKNAQKTKGSLLGLIPDSNSVTYSATFGASNNNIGNGISLQNASGATGVTGMVGGSNLLPTALQVTGLPPYGVGMSLKWNAGFNDALWRKMQMTTAFSPASADVGSIVNEANCITMFRDYSIGTSATVTTYNFLRIIRLADYADLFKKLDFPIFNLRFSLTANLNQISSGLQTAWASAPSTASAMQGQSQLPLSAGGVCPFMITTVGTNVPSLSGLSIQQKVGAGFGAGFTRIYIPSVQLDPVEAERLSREENQVRTVDYLQLQQFQVLAVPLNGGVSQTLANGVSRPIRLTMIPFITPTAAGQGSIAQFASLVDSAGGFTTAPHVGLTNSQVQINGKNLKQNPDNYDTDAFIQNVLPEEAGNIDHDSGSAGLLDLDMWRKSYRYFVWDLSRSNGNNPSSQLSSVQHTASLLSSVGLDLYYFIESLQTLKVNIITGAVDTAVQS